MSVDYNALGLKSEFWCGGDVTLTEKGREKQGDCLWFAVWSAQPTHPRLFVRIFNDATSQIVAKTIRQIKFADLSSCKRKLHLELQSEKEQCTIVLHRNATTGPAARMERIVKVAEAAGDLQNMGDLFACSPRDDIPEIVRLSLKSPGEPPSTMHGGTPRGFSLASATKGSQGARQLAKANTAGGTAGSNRAQQMVAAANTGQPVKKHTTSTGVWKSSHADDPVMRVVSKKSLYAMNTTCASRYELGPSKHQTNMGQYFGSRGSNEGFRNLGNSCYMAAITSVLINLKPFVADLESFDVKLADFPQSKGTRSRMDFFQALLMAARNAASKDHGVMDLTQLKRAIGKRARQFSGCDQQDAHEFYSGCMDAVSTDICRSVKLLSSDDIQGSSASSREPVGDRGATSEAKLPQAVRQLRKLNVCNLNVNLQVSHTLLCENRECGYSRDRRELFRDLSLSLPEDDSTSKGVDLAQLLDAFFADNLLEYTCEKCGHKESRAKHVLHRLPRFLVIHCKRFKPNFEKGIYEKLTSKVNVPQELDLAKYCTVSTRPPPPCDDADRIAIAKTPPESASSSADASNLTRSTVRAAGLKADKRTNPDDVEDLTASEDSPSGSKATRRKISFDHGEADGGAVGRQLTKFLGGSKVPARELPRYGSQARRRGTTLGKSCEYKRESGESYLSRDERRRKEDEEMQIALARSIEVTHKDNWVTDAGQPGMARVSGKTGDEFKRKRVRPVDAADDAIKIDDDDDDEPLVQFVEEDVVADGVMKKRKGTPNKVGHGPGRKDMEGVEKDAFEKGDFSLTGDDDADLQRALELSAKGDCVDEEVTVLQADGEGNTADEVGGEDDDASLFDLCPSDEDNETSASTTPPDARYTLQAVVSHVGNSAARGHYVSDILSSNGRWKRYDDAIVRQIDRDLVSRSEWPRQGYLFVYSHSSCVANKP